MLDGTTKNRRNFRSGLALGLALGVVLALAGAQPPAHAQVSTGDDVEALKEMVVRNWGPDCGAPGAGNVQLGVRIRLRRDGYPLAPPQIENPHPQAPAWNAAAARAAAAVKAVSYRDLSPAQLKTLADRGEIYFKIDQRTACRP